MLANGTKLGYKKKGASESTYTDLTGLKEVPELGNEKEKVENTGLADKAKQYEFGIGDPGDLEYKFKYENTSATSPYRVMRKAEDDGEVLSFCETLPDKEECYNLAPVVKYLHQEADLLNAFFIDHEKSVSED